MSIKDEVRASAAAHADLGPGYDTAVAEGLVERIGEEIDKRIDTRLYGQVPPYQPPAPRPRTSFRLGPERSNAAGDLLCARHGRRACPRDAWNRHQGVQS